MRALRTFSKWIRSLIRRPALKEEIDEELRFHVEQRTAEYAAGMSADDAARAVLRYE